MTGGEVCVCGGGCCWVYAYCVTSGSTLACLLSSFTLTTTSWQRSRSTQTETHTCAHTHTHTHTQSHAACLEMRQRINHNVNLNACVWKVVQCKTDQRCKLYVNIAVIIFYGGYIYISNDRGFKPTYPYPNIPPSPCKSFLPCFCIKAKEFDVYVFAIAAVHPAAALTWRKREEVELPNMGRAGHFRGLFGHRRDIRMHYHVHT